jgi:3-oxoacyl-[acyl-carrier protein] reductase
MQWKEESMKLRGKVALVTGGGRGIGRAIAVALAREGAAVAVTARSIEQLRETVDLVHQAGGQALAVPADIAQKAEADAMVRTVAQALGPVDILVNNAGVAAFAPILEATPEDWRRMLDVNLFGALYCTQAVLPPMIERRRGWIIHISSSSGLKGYPEQGGYCASKHALNGFAKCLALETQHHGIRVHTICPGAVDTELARAHRTQGDDPADWMRPEEIAATVVFLASLDGVATIDSIALRRLKATPWYH